MTAESESVLPAAGQVTVSHLAEHPELIPLLQEWLEAEWPDWYGPRGPGKAEHDLRSFAQRERLPVGLVAFMGTDPIGIGALKPESPSTHKHLLPWAACGFVRPELRGRGIGGQLLTALQHEARALGFPCLYCFTSTSASLLARQGWELIEFVMHEDKPHGIYGKRL